MIIFSLLDMLVTASSEADFVDQTSRPDSLGLDCATAQGKVKTVLVGASSRAQPPPLTPVIVSKAAKQHSGSDKVGSPSSVLQGISLQSEIGAFKETLERKFDKTNDLSRSEAEVVVSFKGSVGEIKSQNLTLTSFTQHQGESVATQQHVQQQKFHDSKEYLEPYPFPPSSLHPSAEHSAAIQSYERQTSLMSIHQSHVKQFGGHLSQEAAEIQRQYLAAAHDSSQGRNSPSVVGQGVHSRFSSPKTSTSVGMESKVNHPYASSFQGPFMFPVSSAFSSHVQSFEQVKHTDEHQFSGVNNYPHIPTNPNEIYKRHTEPYYHQMVNPSSETSFLYNQRHFPIPATDAGVRAYEELLERSAATPSGRHPSGDMPKPASSLSKQSAILIGQKQEGLPTFGTEQHQHHLYYSAAMSGKERIDSIAVDRQDRILTQQANSQNTLQEHSRQVRQEHTRGDKHGREIRKSHGGMMSSVPTIVGDRVPYYHPNILHSRIPQFLRERNMPDSYYPPSGIHPDEKVRPKVPDHIYDYRDQHRIIERMQRTRSIGSIVVPHTKSSREARNSYDGVQRSIGVSSIIPNDQRPIIPSKSVITSDSHYGISSGLAQKTPSQMSITGNGGYLDEARNFEKDLLESHEGTFVIDVKGEKLERSREKETVVSTTLTSAVKSQSKSNRPSSVDSVIHKPLLPESEYPGRKQSSSLVDLRNLPIVPYSLSYPLREAPLIVRPWEKEEKKDNAFAVSKTAGSPSLIEPLRSNHLPSQVSHTESGSSYMKSSPDNDSTYEDPLMSPTIPFTDRGKDMHSFADNSLPSISSKLTGNTMASSIAVKEITHVKNAQEISLPQKDNMLAEHVDVVPSNLSGSRPGSPNDSEATLSADEAEIEMMREGLDEPEKSSEWEELYWKRSSSGLESSSIAVAEECRHHAAFNEKIDNVNSIRLSKSGNEHFEIASFFKPLEQPSSAADLEVSKVIGLEEAKTKGKGKKKQKSNSKRKSPRKGDRAVVEESPSANILKRSDAMSTLSINSENRSIGILSTRPEQTCGQVSPTSSASNKFGSAGTPHLLAEAENEPRHSISSPFMNISQINFYSDATPLTVKDGTPTESGLQEVKLSAFEGENRIVNDDGLHDNQSIVDIEETSAAINSIQTDAVESPSVEEDVGEPYLALWPTAGGYPCDTQPASNTNEADFHREYSSESHATNSVVREKSLCDDSPERDLANISLEMETGLKLALQQADNGSTPTQASNDIFLPDYETTPISPISSTEGSPISPVEMPTSHDEIASSDGGLAYSHSALTVNIAGTSQGSPRAPVSHSKFPFKYSALSSMPASSSGSLHGSGSSSACHSPSTLANTQNSPCYSASFRCDFQESQHSDSLQNLTERLLNNNMVLSQEDNVMLEVTNRPVDSTDNFVFEPLSDED